MPTLSREEIHRRGKQAQRGVTFTAYSSMGLALLWFFAGVAYMEIGKDIRPSMATAVILLTIWWFLLPLVFVLPWRLRQWSVKRIAVCCPGCDEPILDTRETILLTTGRCCGCGAKMDLEGGEGETSTNQASATESKVIPRSELDRWQFSRAAQRVMIVSGFLFYLPCMLMILDIIQDARWVVTGFGAVFAGIVVSLFILHFHNKKLGGGPPKCPCCGLELIPITSCFVSLTGCCERCGNRIMESPMEQPTVVEAGFSRKQLSVAHKRLLRRNSRLSTLVWAFFWSGLAVVFWVTVFVGPEMGEATLRTVLAVVFIVLPTVAWVLESRIPKTSTFACPLCHKSLLGKVTPISVATGRCWNCASKIFDDAE